MALNLPSRKGVGLVRRLLPDIEAAVREGATLDQVHAALQSDYGLTLTFDSFKNALYRARKDNKGGKPEAPGGDIPPARANGEGEKTAPRPQDEKPEPPRKKRGIISPKDFRPSPGIEEELEKLGSKKYE